MSDSRNGVVWCRLVMGLTRGAVAGAAVCLLCAPVTGKQTALPIAWDQWGEGAWQAYQCEVRAEKQTLIIVYTVGEAPDVWPNAQRTFTTPFDMSRYERFEFEVKVTSSKADLPDRSLSLLLGTPADARWQQDAMPNRLVPGEWIRETIDLAALPVELLSNIGHFQFFVWNRDYHNAGRRLGDIVTFEVRNAQLTGERSTKPRSVFHEKPLQRILATGRLASVWAEPPDTKILPEQALPTLVARERGVVRLEAAANEYVDCQIAVRSRVALQQVAVRITLPGLSRSGADGDAVLIRPEGLVKTKTPSWYQIRTGLCPDPLLTPGPVDIPEGETRAFWVRVHVPPRTRKGTYSGEVTIHSSAAELARGRLALKVYGFELPRETHLKTAFQFAFEKGWSRFLDYYPNGDFSLFKRIWESMAQHRLAPMHLGPSGPPRPADEKSLAEFSRYVDLAKELGFNSFLSFYWDPPVDTEENRQWVKQMLDYYQRKGVFDRTFAYLCQFDEAQRERWPALVKHANALKAAEPRLVRMLTVPPAPELYGALDVWCPGTHAYNRDLADQRRKLGEKVWWYTCGQWTPGLLIDHPGTMHRALLWLSWTQRVDGLLFWCINYWQKNPWEESWQGPGTSGNGDGYFLYPPRPGDPPDRFYESIRWELLRDSIEDYEYFWLLRERLQPAEKRPTPNKAAIAQALAALAAVERVATDVKTYSLAVEDYAYARRKAAEAIEALGDKKGTRARVH